MQPLIRVAVTRPRERSGHGFDVLRELGFVPLVRRLIRIEAADAELLSAITHLRDADWVLFTSAEAVRAMDRARRLASLSWPSQVRAACVGPATAKAATQAGLTIGLIPDVFDGAALAEALLRDHDTRSQKFLWPRAEAANSGLADRLRQAGATVTDVIAYRTVPNAVGAQRLRRDLDAKTIAAVLFFSPSAVDSFAGLVGTVPADVIVAVIGRSTGERARIHNIPVHVQPATHTIKTLAESLREYIDSN